MLSLGFRLTSAPSICRTTLDLFHGSSRGMAVYVEVKGNRIEQALAELNRKREEAGIPEELRKRRNYINGSDQKFEDNKKSYKHAVGRVVTERIKWVMKRRRAPGSI